MISNRGTGAGGARTNETGLSWEEKTHLVPPYATKVRFGTQTNVGVGR